MRHVILSFTLSLLLVASASCTGYVTQHEPAPEAPAHAEHNPGTDGPTPNASDCTTEPRDPGPALVRRLTVPEYIETVQSTLGVDINEDARRLLPEDVNADGFSNTAYNLTVDLAHVEAYAELSRIVTAKLDLSAFAAQYADCAEMTPACFREVITNMGKWVLRGPLIDQEVDALLGVYTSVADEGGDFEEAVNYVLQWILQSNRFLYRVENQRGDDGVAQVDGYELASRLSYFLWSAPPDKELMAAADAGQLSEPSHLHDQIERMLADPRAIKTSQRFVHEWLSLDRLATLAPDPAHYPQWNDQLAADMRAETLAFFEHVAWTQGRPLSDLFTAQVTFATPQLASHYGFEPRGEGMVEYDLSDVPSRGGLLTQASVLTIGGDEASMVARGLFLLRDVLCSGVNDPPPGVDTTPVPPEPGKSQRMMAEERVANPSCGGCHSRFEPLAYGLGKFDGIGAYREADEYGNELRDDGQIFFPAQSQPLSYDNSAQMMQLLADNQRVQLCMTHKVAQFAIGRPLTESDECILRDIRQRAQDGGGTYASLIAAIATSDLVHLTRTER